MSDRRHLWIGDPLRALEHRPDGMEVVASARVARTAGLRAGSLQARARERLRAHGVRVASALAAWRSLGAAVREEVGASDAHAWRRALRGPVATLLEAGAIPRSGEAPTLPPGLSTSSRRAWSVARRHAAQLARDGRIDEAALIAVAASLPPGEDEAAIPPWFVVAPTGVRPAEGRWLASAAPPGSIVALPPEAHDAVMHLGDLGFVASDDAAARIDTSGEAARVRAYRFPSSDEEARWMLAQAGRTRTSRRSSGGTDRVVVVADPAAAAARLEAVAWEIGVPIRIDRPLSLRATGVGAFLSGIADAVGRDAPYEATLALLRHRLAGEMDADAYAQARTQRPSGAAAWASIDRRCEALAWPSEATRERYVGRLEALLEAFDLARDALPLHERAALHLVVRSLREDAGQEHVRIERRVFLADLVDLLDLLSVRAPTRSPASADATATGDRSTVTDASRARARPDATVLVVSPEQAAEMKTDRLWFLGFAEGIVPPNAADAAILDAHDRARLRTIGVDLPDAGARARAAWCGVASAIRAARSEVVLGVPALADGVALLPSPYLERFGLEPRPAPPRPAASPEERRRVVLQRAAEERPDAPPGERDPVLTAAVRAWRIERRRESARPADRFDGRTGRPLPLDGEEGWRFSATSLQTLGQCGFHFFARYRLGITPLDEHDERITPQLRGRLWHVALERAMRLAWMASDEVPLRERVVTALPVAYAEAEQAEAVPDVDGDAWQRIRTSELQTLERFVRSDAFLEPDARPREVEMRFEGVFRGMAVRGIVDRVDQRGDGIELIDYKSGTTKPKGALADDRRSWIDVQLPLYLEAAAPRIERSARQGGDHVRARYLSIRDARTLLTVEPGQHDAALDELAGRVRRICASGSWDVDPDPSRDVCRTCDFALVCRVGPRIDRKRDASTAGLDGTSR